MTMLTEISLHDAALRQVQRNVESEPAIEEAYLFPSTTEIRLIYVDATAPPLRSGEEIAPFYFSEDEANGVPYPLALTLIRPEEAGIGPLPRGWGTWNDAEVIWKKEK